MRRRWRGAFVLMPALLGPLLAVVFSPDPLSAAARIPVQSGLQSLLDGIRDRFATRTSTVCDRAVLRAGAAIGAAIGGVAYPEGAAVLRHALADTGEVLRLDAAWFRQDPWLEAQIRRLGPGVHGPIGARLDDDPRLALAINPFYLDIHDDEVRLFHPTMRFAAAEAAPVPTVVPIGLLRLKVWDNLVGALQTRSFVAEARWRRAPAPVAR